jgi:hypothetical protein
VVIVADSHGAIWRSDDSGKRWRRVAPPSARPYAFTPWYSDLSCQGGNAIELSQAFCQASTPTCGTDVLSWIRQTTDRARTWRTVVKQKGGGPTDGGVHTHPRSALQLPLDRAAVAGTRGVCLLGDSFLPPASAEIS